MKRLSFVLLSALLLFIAPTPMNSRAAAALPLQLLNPYAAVREPISTVTQSKHQVTWNGYGIDIATSSSNASAVYLDAYWSNGSAVTMNVTDISPWNLYYCNGSFALTQYSVQLKYVYADGAVAQIEFWHLDVPSVSEARDVVLRVAEALRE